MISVNIRTEPMLVGSPLECLLAVREEVGERNAFLFESLAGPAVDARSSLIGITGLLEVSVHDGEVSMKGLPALIKLVSNALRAAGVAHGPGGSLVLVDGDALWQLPRVIDAQFDFARDPGAFGFGLLVCYGYDAVGYIEQLPRTIEDSAHTVPDAVFSLVHGMISIDLSTATAAVVAAESSEWPELDLRALKDIIERTADTDHQSEDAPVAVPPASAISDDVIEEDYLRRAEICLEHIRLGDIYQVQLGHEITVTSAADHLDVYRRLRWRNPSPYMCVLPVAGMIVVGASPELFVRIEGGEVTMRPIAGTARRQGCDEANEGVVNALLNEPKERAEHIMLVDLCRNDLGRIAEPMSTEVRDLMLVETYSHMFHIVSNVTARVDKRFDVYDVIRASFPAGTMTGAPKVRAMEIIESLETSRRGLYAGSFGVVGFGGWSVLGLAIRMAVHSDGTYRIRASAGIVADSSPQSEWNETLTKLGATYWAVTGEELT